MGSAFLAGCLGVSSNYQEHCSNVCGRFGNNFSVAGCMDAQTQQVGQLSHFHNAKKFWLHGDFGSLPLDSTPDVHVCFLGSRRIGMLCGLFHGMGNMVGAWGRFMDEGQD